MERFGEVYWMKTNGVEHCVAWIIPMRSWSLRVKGKDNDHHLEKLKKCLRESSRIFNIEMKSINRKHANKSKKQILQHCEILLQHTNLFQSS